MVSTLVLVIVRRLYLLVWGKFFKVDCDLCNSAHDIKLQAFIIHLSFKTIHKDDIEWSDSRRVDFVLCNAPHDIKLQTFIIHQNHT